MVEAGDTIKGYKIIQEFTTVGGGLSRWTFAEKDGKVYFLKEFLAPKYPKDDSPGSEKVKAQRRKRCEKFEHHHRALKMAIGASTGTGGNLVATIDFFRHGTTYYKVTEKVDVSTVKPDDVYRLPMEQRILVLKTVAHSLQVLHQLNIVHGDLKPDNILIKKNDAGVYIAKLIDFDNSYFAKNPPAISDDSDIVGTPAYYSPELGRYIMRDPIVTASDLDTSSDIFTLGLIFSQYLTGRFPKFNPKCRYAWESANSGNQPSLNGVSLPATLKKLVNIMLEINPKTRPPIRTVFQTLKNWDKIETVKRGGDLSVAPSSTGSRLKGKGLIPHATETAKPTKTPTPLPSEPVTVSRLRGKLVEKKK